MSGLARAISSEASSDGYEPKVILITGAAGFIGSHTALRLVKNLPNVRVSWESERVFQDVRVEGCSPLCSFSRPCSALFHLRLC